jgi:hypothetical protein
MPAKKQLAKGSNKPNGRAHRDILRQGNRAWMIRYKVKTRQFRRERTKQQPGNYQGLHDPKNSNCVCGSCNRGYTKTKQ